MIRTQIRNRLSLSSKSLLLLRKAKSPKLTPQSRLRRILTATKLPLLRNNPLRSSLQRSNLLKNSLQRTRQQKIALRRLLKFQLRTQLRFLPKIRQLQKINSLMTPLNRALDCRPPTLRRPLRVKEHCSTEIKSRMRLTFMNMLTRWKL